MVAFQLKSLLILIYAQSTTSFQQNLFPHPVPSYSSINDIDCGSRSGSSRSVGLVSTLDPSAAATIIPMRATFQTRGAVMRCMANNNNNNNDIDDDFDPLLSPHAYPKGTSSRSNQNDKNNNNDDDWSPFKMKTVKDDFKGANDDEYGVEKSVFTRKWSTTINSVEGAGDEGTTSQTTDDNINNKDNENNNDVSTFDPLISPHFYPKGTSAGPVQSKKVKKASRIGVLLIDHGSRREASNAHLEKLAELYQERAPSNYIIKAAHMEIARPSIKDGIESLIEEDKVDKIICHPYFLSPGRHVVEDIPQLIQEAMDELQVGLKGGDDDDGNSDVEVLTTSHVGSSMAMMVDLISTMVDDTVGVEPDSGFVEKGPSSLGGFFGEVQRMLDEQL